MKRRIHRIKEQRLYKYNVRLLRLHGAKIGSNFSCNGKLYVSGSGFIDIGKDVTINSSIENNPVAGVGYSAILMQGGKLQIGDGVGISNTSITCANGIIIEKDVAIGAGCMIADTDFHSLNVIERHREVDLGIRTAPIKIREGAFVGSRAIILKGVTIGKESVVGAGSVVTKDIPDGEIWAGNPAKYIRSLEKNEND